MSELEVAKIIVPMLGAPLVKAIIDTWLAPKFQELVKTNQTNSDITAHSFLNKFSEYLERALDKQSYITTIVFQNQRKRLEDLYIPLRVNGANTVIPIDSYRDDFIPAFRRVLLTDNAGMGKSTILKYLFVACVIRNAGIPILVELRRLSGETRIIDLICADLNPIDDEFNPAFIRSLIRRGDFVFFFDGYDEIPIAQREEVTRELQEFIGKANRNEFIITSRPEEALASFPDFERFSIEPLELEEAFALIRTYDCDGEKGEELIGKLEGATLTHVREFLNNPLLVSLLYKSYSYKPTIPLQKHTFYRQVFDALFETHDLTKPGAFVRDKHSKLDIEGFHRVLRTLGFLTSKGGKVEYSKDEILHYIAEARSLCVGMSFTCDEYLSDLLITVPLFVRDGDNYRWSHKSIQEYFAAAFICMDAKDKQEAILRALCKEPNILRFANIIDLCYEIDYKTFRDVIIWDVAQEFSRYHENSYNSINNPLIPEEWIEERKRFTFGSKYVITTNKNANKIKHRIKTRQSRPTPYLEGMILTCTIYGNNWIVEGYSSKYGIISSILCDRLDSVCSKSKLHIDNIGDFHAAVDEGEYVIDDDPNGRYNQPDVFQSVTSLIMLHQQRALDFEACCRVQADIQRARSQDAGDSLLEGLL